jgi:hypothetical protein
LDGRFYLLRRAHSGKLETTAFQQALSCHKGGSVVALGNE